MSVLFKLIRNTNRSHVQLLSIYQQKLFDHDFILRKTENFKYDSHISNTETTTEAYSIMLRNLCVLKDLDKCEEWLEEQKGSRSLNLSDEELLQLVTNAINSNVESTMVINFLKLYFNFRKDQYISTHLFESILNTYLNSKDINIMIEIVNFLKFVCQLNEKSLQAFVLEKSSSLNNVKIKSYLSSFGFELTDETPINLAKSISNRFKEHFSLVLAEHNNMAEIVLILNKLKELSNKSLKKKRKDTSCDHFEAVFDHLINLFLKKQKYKNVIDLMESFGMHNKSFNHLLAGILNTSKNDFENFERVLKLVLNLNVNLKASPFDLENHLCFDAYSVTEINKLNEYLYKNPLDINASGRFKLLYRDDENVMIIKRAVYSAQMKAFLCIFEKLVRSNSIRFEEENNLKNAQDKLNTISSNSSIFKYFISEQHDENNMNYFNQMVYFGLQASENQLKLFEIYDLILNDLIEVCELNGFGDTFQFKVLDFLLQTYFKFFGMFYNFDVNLPLHIVESMNLYLLNSLKKCKKKSLLNYLTNSLIKNNIKISFNEDDLDFIQQSQLKMKLLRQRFSYEKYNSDCDALNSKDSLFSLKNLLDLEDENCLKNLLNSTKENEIYYIRELNRRMSITSKQVFAKREEFIEILLNFQIVRRYLQNRLGETTDIEENIYFLVSLLENEGHTFQELTLNNIFYFNLLQNSKFDQNHKLNLNQFEFFFENIDNILEKIGSKKDKLDSCLQMVLRYYLDNGGGEKVTSKIIQSFKYIFLKRNFTNFTFEHILKSTNLKKEQAKHLCELVELSNMKTFSILDYQNFCDLSQHSHVIDAFLKLNRLNEAIIYYHQLVSMKVNTESKVLSLNIIDCLIKKNEYLILDSFIGSMTKIFGLCFTVNCFIFALVFNNYNEKAKNLLEKYSRNAYDSSIFLTNFYYTLYNHLDDEVIEDVKPIECFLDFITSNQVDTINVEDFFVLLFNRLIKGEKFQQLDYFADKYRLKLENFKIVQQILATKNLNHEYENRILSVNDSHNQVK